MSREAHTAGPWVFSFESIDPEWAVVTTAGGAIIANVNADHRQEANARLIAAAPALLAVSKAFVAHYPMGINPMLDQAFRDARAAIQSATGEG